MTQSVAIDSPRRRSRLRRLRARLRELYHGRSERSIRFRLGVIAIDLAVIAFFIATPFLRSTPAFLVVDYVIATIVAADIAARALAWSDLRSWIRRPIVWVDLFVLATLLAPQWLFTLAFLRVLRLWTLLHSEFFWRTIGRRLNDTRWEDATRTGATLVTFVFIVTGVVYASYARVHPAINGYMDALYFTVTTLTTTGFGDITLPGAWGRLISIVTMVTGITLFVRLAQKLMRPYKVRFVCPTCALMRHDPDAVFCKACGTQLSIPNDTD